MSFSLANEDVLAKKTGWMDSPGMAYCMPRVGEFSHVPVMLPAVKQYGKLLQFRVSGYPKELP
jgi:hypothetical protein